MIVKEFFRTRKDGAKLYKTYSDKNVFIQKVNTNEVYDEAIDIESANFKYIIKKILNYITINYNKI